MKANVLSNFTNLFTEDNTKKYYSKSYVRKNYWPNNYNFDYVKNYYHFGRVCDGQTYWKYNELFTIINNDLIIMSVVKAFNLPLSHQKSMERFYKIICIVTLMEKISTCSSTKLTENSLIDKASEIIKHICLITKDDRNLLKAFDIQLQEIEKITINMGYDMGLTVISTISSKILKSPQDTIINMLKCKDLQKNIEYDPITISDDKSVFVKRNFNCLKIGGTQVQITKKIYLQNTDNVNVLGRLIGPCGRTIQNLENTTRSRLYIRGRGSIRNSFVEEGSLRQKICEHLNEPLHILIIVYGTSEVVCYRKLEYIRRKIVYILSQKPSIIGWNNYLNYF
uniref:K Homology domain-containing protein n=1 Tax=Strongyloides stercoralis TaxID=6248 RepID=A0A0K0DYQ6_STRER